MITKSRRLEKFGLAFCLLVSLFASSVSAACFCSHHGEKQAVESTDSCHAHPVEEKHPQNQQIDSTRAIESAITETVCVCFQTTPKVFAKSENNKSQKQITAVLPQAAVEIAFASQTAPSKFDFAKPSYLSDSFYNLAPGRAPPVL